MSSKVWIVTGCSSGFDNELTRGAVWRGDTAIFTIRNAARLESLKTADSSSFTLNITASDAKGSHQYRLPNVVLQTRRRLLKENFSTLSSSSACCFSSYQPPVLEWQNLHSCCPTSAPSRRRVNCLSKRSVTSAECGIATEDSLVDDEEQKVLLKTKAPAIVEDLRGTCIFLVGMMGSGKTTVGKFIADALGYYFFDSDKLVEDAAGGITVQQMFREGDEEEFRNAESEVLMQLSSMGRLVVATGGGAVVRPQNWGYLRHGITVWLDVPVEALAKRVVAVGCESRPLLRQTSPETAYNQALKSLENLFEQRVDYYKNADACVSVAGLATTMGLEDVSAVTPAMLAVQVLDEIAVLIRNKRKVRHDLGNL